MLWCRFQGDPLLSFPESLCHFKSHLFRAILPFKPTLFRLAASCKQKIWTADTLLCKSLKTSFISLYGDMKPDFRVDFLRCSWAIVHQTFWRNFKVFLWTLANFSPVIVPVLTFKHVRITPTCLWLYIYSISIACFNKLPVYFLSLKLVSTELASEPDQKWVSCINSFYFFMT